jgi:hypothetical protein
VDPKSSRSVEFASSSNTPTSPTLSGRQLFLARVGWLVVALLSIVLFSASIPAHYDWLINFANPDLEPATVRANLDKVGISVDFYATYLLSIRAASVVVWVAVAVIIFWRRSDNSMALFTSLTLLTFAVFFLSAGPTVLAKQHPALWLPVNLLTIFSSMSFALFLYLFPNGRFEPRWTRWVLVIWATHEVAYYFFPDSILNTERFFPPLDFAIISTFLCVGIGSQLYRYRRVSGPIQRQQTKWVVFGTVSSLLGLIGVELLLNGSKTLAQFGSPYLSFALYTGTYGFMLLIPLSIGVAILRNRLWDIDVIINRTLVYGTLIAILGLLYYLGVVLLQALLSDVTDQGSQLAATASTLAVVALFMPLRRRIRKFIDKRFFRTKYDARKTLEAFGARVREEGDLQKLSGALVEVVDETMKPAYVSLWLRPPPKRRM